MVEINVIEIVVDNDPSCLGDTNGINIESSQDLYNLISRTKIEKMFPECTVIVKSGNVGKIIMWIDPHNPTISVDETETIALIQNIMDMVFQDGNWVVKED